MTEQDNDIFKVLDLAHSGGRAEAVVIVNNSSKIFAGHFPGQPVVPGACMLQLVKDVLEKTLNLKLRLKTARQMKFMAIVVPGDDQLRLSMSFTIAEDNTFSVQADLTNGETVCFKFQGIFVAE